MPMITCSDCNKEMSDSAPACPSCGKPNANNPSEKKSVGIILSVGILFFPIIFSWLTLRKGHSSLAKIISFSWLVLWLISTSAINKTPNTTSPVASTSVSQPKNEIKQVKQVAQVNIRDILSAYKNNEVGADNQYKDKTIQITGTIGSIKKDILGSLYVTLGTGAQFEIPQVQAFFDDSQNNQLAQLSKGSKLTVECRIEGLMMNVLAKECVIK